jgi:isoquinoline 1-oxidoreductase alpha subunit
MPPYSLIINGRQLDVDAPAEKPLLWVLREDFGLKGTKYGCGVGICGACTVHLDDEPIRSCVTQIASVANRSVISIEGLSPDGTNPLQLAWVERDVSQCGYCQAGQIMSAAALLARTPSPTDEDVDRAMSGNLCRCGTYRRIRAAIHQAAELKREEG